MTTAVRQDSSTGKSQRTAEKQDRNQGTVERQDRTTTPEVEEQIRNTISEFAKSKHPPNRRILRPQRQADLLDISRATLYRFAKLPDFPKMVRLGANSVGRFEDELLAWAVSRQEG